MKITLNIIEPVLRDIISATVHTMQQADKAAASNNPSWPTAENDLIALDVLFNELVSGLVNAKFEESLAAKGGAA